MFAFTPSACLPVSLFACLWWFRMIYITGFPSHLSLLLSLCPAVYSPTVFAHLPSSIDCAIQFEKTCSFEMISQRGDIGGGRRRQIRLPKPASSGWQQSQDTVAPSHQKKVRGGEGEDFKFKKERGKKGKEIAFPSSFVQYTKTPLHFPSTLPPLLPLLQSKEEKKQHLAGCAVSGPLIGLS